MLRLLVVKVATPVEATLPVPSCVVASRKVTVPVGAACPAAGTTWAANVTACPAGATGKLAVSATVVVKLPVVAALTVIPTGWEALAASCVVPL